MEKKIEKYNSIILEKLSYYLNFKADFIKEDIINELVNTCNLKSEEAFSIILAEVCGFDIENNPEHMEIFRRYFYDMICHLNEEEYKNNPYYMNIKIPEIQVGRWEFKIKKYSPYEAFVFNDLKKKDDGRIIPQIGFFDSEFKFPTVLESKKEWMLITPNEIETMKCSINSANGDVLTFGLGLGYYAYMVSEKSNVKSVTVVERDKDVIELFTKYILPQFKYGNKIKIIHADAFSYAKEHMKYENYDIVFTDLWHDPSDGIDKYLKMKKLEMINPKSKYMYWIEKTILCYLEC